MEEGREGRAFLSRRLSMLRASPVKGIESSVQGEVCGELRMQRAERALVRCSLHHVVWTLPQELGIHLRAPHGLHFSFWTLKGMLSGRWGQ